MHSPETCRKNPLHVLTIIGARPQFIKAAVLSHALSVANAAVTAGEPGRIVRETLVHTGQHYDANMSEVFFTQLNLPVPDHHLGIAGLTHGAMTGRMLKALEGLIRRERPDWVLVYGDTNSTLAGALAAAKQGVAVAHVEAGLRSHNADMPEEINRVLTDRVSRLLLCPTSRALSNLKQEGYPFPAPGYAIQRLSVVGDVMYDAVRHYQAIAREQVALKKWGLEEQGYVLATLHRQDNTDQAERLLAILSALQTLAQEQPVVLPLHPRTRAQLERLGAKAALAGLHVLDPLPYLEMQRLLMSARRLLTDSGGLQKEAYFYQVPCVTLREETEWVETLADGWNQLAGADRERILAAAAQPRPSIAPAPHYGDGQAAERILAELLHTEAD